ncbi:sensor histidine kinase [Mucilaginibacter daejeonensis]|uniref:sensor histidine kinase n=1 Tax=Mucilaginibacter daejeonensis TaxID=398049 RepID=UPI001D173892|nr:sensor histidine kinase [Mucilaginibacter daejeonensis]UEG51367.1 sensor histidine kinase [Mucilaginibacter daejeonensis]
MRKKERWYLLAGWLLYLVFLTIAELLNLTHNKASLLSFSFYLSCLACFSLSYTIAFPLAAGKHRMIKLVTGLLLSVAIFVICRYLLEEVLFNYLFGIRNYNVRTSWLRYFVDNVFYASLVTTVSAAMYSGFHTLHQEQENKTLREEKMKAELSFLKSQINPHFLYNTLNYFYSLAYPVSEQLGHAVIQLSHLMRYMLTDASGSDVPLQKEIEYIENYITLYRMLFEERFFVKLQVEGKVDLGQIVPLILIGFVENAFKHGVVNDPNHPVIITLKIKDGQLLFRVINQISTAQKDHSTGIGLSNIKRRLDLIYPNARHQLDIKTSQQFFEVNLSILL